MLIEFSVGNFLSFKEIKTFSMLASSRKEFQETHVFDATKKIKLLKSAIFYGANASGKSNLFKAINFTKRFVFNSAKNKQQGENIGISNFKLSTDTEKEPSYFEIIFIYKKIRYRYGFEANNKRVFKEWLLYAPKGKEALLFSRDDQRITIGTNFKEAKGLKEKTRENALFLSVVAQFNGPIASSVLKGFRTINVVTSDSQYIGYTIKKLEKDKEFKKIVVELLKVADLGIEDIIVKKTAIPLEELPSHLQQQIGEQDKEKVYNLQVGALHKKVGKKDTLEEKVRFDINAESEGTKKFLALTGPLFDTLSNGKTLIIDELDARMHPLLIQFILHMFNSSKYNFTNAQLIFNSQNTYFLDKRYFRRDQIWFIEKSKFGATDLYSLLEYRVRKTDSFNKDYVRGKYGAVPFIGKLDTFLKDFGDISG